MPPSNQNKVCVYLVNISTQDLFEQFIMCSVTELNIKGIFNGLQPNASCYPQGNQLECSYLSWISLPICYDIISISKSNIVFRYTVSTGDPALDYIGTGGAAYLPEDSVIPGRC